MRIDIFTDRIADVSADYELDNVMGKGAFGVVRLAKHRSTGAIRAVKSISKGRLCSAEDVEDIKREVEILYTLSPHKTIADLVTVYEDGDSVHIVMEYCAGGELFDRIVAKGTFSEAEAARYFRQMVEVVAHCHALGVMHRDIKPENFLLSDRTDAADLLACDFGLGAFYKQGQMLSTLVGSAFYVAPEVLRRRYGPEADLWSLGVVLYILLCGVPPFYGQSDKETFTAILRGSPDMTSAPWPCISQAAKDLLRDLLNVDPAARATIDALLQHPWLVEHGVAPAEALDTVVISRMRRFATLTRIKKAAMLAAARHLSPSEIQGMQELFRSFDANGDGQITPDELYQGLRASCGPKLTASEVEEMLRCTDVDASGAIDYNEFLAATVNVALLHREEVLEKLFKELDSDGSGTLSVEEVERAIGSGPLGQIDHDEVLEFVRSADLNRDGVIDFDEFVKAWRTQGAGEKAMHAAKVVKRGLPSIAEHLNHDTK